MEIIFAPQVFRDMILFSGRFANPSIQEQEFKEVYGFLIGKIINNETLYIRKLIPMIHGSRTEVYFSEQDYAISEKLMDEIFKANLFVCGWFHTHPGLDLFLSEVDIYNQLGFQSVFNNAIAMVFDFTKITANFNGFKAFRLENIEDEGNSKFIEVPYQIEKPPEDEKFFMARSLLDLSDSQGSNQPFIKEAGEIFKETGSFDSIFSDLKEKQGASTTNNKPFSSVDIDNVRTSDLRDFKQQISELDNTYFHSMDQTPTQTKKQSKSIQKRARIHQSIVNANKENLNFETSSNYAPQFLDPIPSKFETEDSSNFDSSTSNYYELLENYTEDDWEIHSLRERIENAKEKGEPTGILLLRLADRLLTMSNSEEALGYLESAESEFSNNNDTRGLISVKNELGLYYEERGDYNSSLNYFESAQKLVQETNDVIYLIQILNNIGNVYLSMNEHDKAWNYYKDAYIKSYNINYTLGMVAALNNAADVLLFLKNYGVVYSILVFNYQFFNKQQNAYGVGVTYSKFGQLYFEQGDRYYNLSEKFFRAALENKVSSEQLKETTEDWIYLSKIFISRGDKDSAEISLTHGLNIIRTYDIPKEEGKFYRLLGDLYLFSDRIEDSAEYFKLALICYSDFADEENISKMNEKLADIYLNFYKNNEEAFDYLYSALESYRTQHYSKMIAETLVKLADLQLDMDRKINAIELLEEAKQLYQSLYDENGAEEIEEKLRNLRE
jgi:tetratricopeptide (TPR) repeat protein